MGKRLLVCPTGAGAIPFPLPYVLLKTIKDDEFVEITESSWYKETKAAASPGDAMRIYRENQQMTQAQLGERLGGLPRQTVSSMERGRRAISLATARKLAAIFAVPVSRFLDLQEAH